MYIHCRHLYEFSIHNREPALLLFVVVAAKWENLFGYSAIASDEIQVAISWQNLSPR